VDFNAPNGPRGSKPHRLPKWSAARQSRNDAAVVFDDVRFANEARAILAAGGSMVRVERAGAGASTPGHSSETEVGSLPASMTIRNDGSLDRFLRDVSYVFALDD